ncbi:MAG: hypothetical protein H2172_09210 [Opitutus sp.]|nr:hypothetical protein [Opitutus sp.]MCS6276533.1 hypothetical protein [Opitutus sp.]MCS6301819.1 hypothetical protein [Opitutus sp.]
MNYRNCVLIAVTSLLSATFACANVTFTGITLFNATGLAAGEVGVLLVDNNNSGFSSISIQSGSSLNSSATYGGFSALTSNTVITALGNTSLSLPLSDYSLPIEVNAGSKFATVSKF